MISKYRSRKFILTILVFAATTALAIMSKMDAHVATIFSALIISYNGMQGWIDKNG